MQIRPLPLSGAFLLEIDRVADERGFFARTWSREQLEQFGLSATVSECSISYNKKNRTVRGLHFQEPPYAEVKLVRCQRGAVFDVIVDIRPDSQTFLSWYGTALSAENALSLYIPEGFAHGFQTLRDESEVHYMISAPYRPEAARTINWRDADIGISWPYESGITISQKDNAALGAHQVLGR